MTVEPLRWWQWWGWGVGGLPPPPADYQAGSYSFIITSPTLAGERKPLIPKVSILWEQIGGIHFESVWLCKPPTFV